MDGQGDSVSGGMAYYQAPLPARLIEDAIDHLFLVAGTNPRTTELTDAVLLCHTFKVSAGQPYRPR